MLPMLRTLASSLLLCACAFAGNLPDFSHYTPVSVSALAKEGTEHTHIAVTGTVAVVRHEADGDLHIRLTEGSAFIIAECQPEIPCKPPHKGQQITVYGVSRYDGQHKWWEVHPVEKLISH